MVAVKEKMTKKKKGNRNKKTKITEVSKVFKDAIEYWEGLASDVDSEMYETLGILNITEGIDPEEFNNEDLANLIKAAKRSIKSTHDKVEKLEDSLSSIGMITPIDELELKVIGALRVLNKKWRNLGGCETDIYKSLIPIFKLAGKVGFSFPNWLRDYAYIPEQKDDDYSIGYYGKEARYLRWYDWSENARKILGKVISLKEISSNESIKKQLDQAKKNCRDISTSICHYHGDDIGKIAQKIKGNV